MVSKISLALGLLAYLLQSLSGVTFERALMRSLIFFVISYALISGYELLYLHIKYRFVMLEEEKKRAEKLQREEERRNQAGALAQFIKESNLN